jgi:hypothetical protein
MASDDLRAGQPLPAPQTAGHARGVVYPKAENVLHRHANLVAVRKSRPIRTILRTEIDTYRFTRKFAGLFRGSLKEKRRILRKFLASQRK